MFVFEGEQGDVVFGDEGVFAFDVGFAELAVDVGGLGDAEGLDGVDGSGGGFLRGATVLEERGGVTRAESPGERQTEMGVERVVRHGLDCKWEGG